MVSVVWCAWPRFEHAHLLLHHRVTSPSMRDLKATVMKSNVPQGFAAALNSCCHFAVRPPSASVDPLLPSVYSTTRAVVPCHSFVGAPEHPNCRLRGSAVWISRSSPWIILWCVLPNEIHRPQQRPLGHKAPQGDLGCCTVCRVRGPTNQRDGQDGAERLLRRSFGVHGDEHGGIQKK